MVRGPGGEIMAVRLRGIDPSRVASVTDLSDDIIAGSVEALLPSATAEGEPPAILVGSRLARTVGVVLGDSMLLVCYVLRTQLRSFTFPCMPMI